MDDSNVTNMSSAQNAPDADNARNANNAQNADNARNANNATDKTSGAGEKDGAGKAKATGGGGKLNKFAKNPALQEPGDDAEYRDEFIVIIDEDGEEVAVEHIDTVAYNGSEYVVLAPIIEDDFEDDIEDFDDDEFADELGGLFDRFLNRSDDDDDDDDDDGEFDDDEFDGDETDGDGSDGDGCGHDCGVAGGRSGGRYHKDNRGTNLRELRRGPGSDSVQSSDGDTDSDDPDSGDPDNDNDFDDDDDSDSGDTGCAGCPMSGNCPDENNDLFDEEEVVILRVQKEADGTETYVTIDDEEEQNAVFDLFMERQEEEAMDEDDDFDLD